MHMHDAYCRMWWMKLSGVKSSRRKKAWTSRFWIGWYLNSSLWWKNSWKVRLYFFHSAPYGENRKAKPHFILAKKIWKVLRRRNILVIHTVQPSWEVAFCRSSLKTFARTGRSSVAGSPKSKRAGLGHWSTPYRLKWPVQVVFIVEVNRLWNTYHKSFSIHRKRATDSWSESQRDYRSEEGLWVLVVEEDHSDYAFSSSIVRIIKSSRKIM